MDCREIIVFISNLKSYPVNLAKKIGCEKAVLWYELFRKYADSPFQFTSQLTLSLGILDGEKVFKDLYYHEYLTKENDQYKINFDKLEEESGGASLSSDIKPPFSDNNFITLLSDFQRVLVKRGRKVDKKKLYAQFDGVTLAQAIEALRKAIQNEWVTLHFQNEKPTSNAYGGARKPQSSGGTRYSSGGSTARKEAVDWGETEIG